MVSIEEIGPQTLRAWLEKQTPEVSLRFAHRVAARVLPLADPEVWGHYVYPDRDDPARYRCALSAVRSNLILHVLSHDVGAIPVERLETYVDFAERAYISFEDIFDQNLGGALAAPIAGISGAIVLRHPGSRFADTDGGSQFIAAGISQSVESVVSRVTVYGEGGHGALPRDDLLWWNEVRTDAAAALNGNDTALRLSASEEAAWVKAREVWRKRGSGWAFWISWYEAILVGRALDWGLLKSIANFPDSVWERGAEVVAAEIARIEEQLRLQGEVSRLREQLEAAHAEIAAFSKRSHNNPPELVEPATELQHNAGEIAGALREAETELAKGAPRPAVLRRVGAALLVAAEKSLSYCASLSDVALKKAAEEIGSAGTKALIGAGLLAWLSQLEAVQTLGKALQAFARLLGGG